MPYITARMFEGRLDDAAAEQLIEALTDATASVLGDAVRDETWVVLEEVPRSRWGFAGRTRS